MVIHRNDWSVLRPLVLETRLQLEDLAQAGIFVADTLDVRLATAKQCKYDILVSLPEKWITISPDSTADLKMCGFHEEVAAQVMSTCADALTTNDSICCSIK